MDYSFSIPVLGNAEPTTSHKAYDADKNEWYDVPGVIWAQMKIETDVRKVEEIENIFTAHSAKISPGRLNNIRYKTYAVRHAQ